MMLLSRCVRACVCVCACMFACLCVCVCVMVRCCHYDGRGGGGRLSTSLGSGTCTHTAFLDVAHPCMAHLIGSQALSHAQLTPHSAAVGPSQCMAHVSIVRLCVPGAHPAAAPCSQGGLASGGRLACANNLGPTGGSRAAVQPAQGISEPVRCLALVPLSYL